MSQMLKPLMLPWHHKLCFPSTAIC